jgi:DNA-binding FadR family transcriptional regulator
VLPVRQNLEERQREHERMLRACVENDPDAGAFELHNHLARTANLIATQMGGEELFELHVAAEVEG